jgi:hypothetical protein
MAAGKIIFACHKTFEMVLPDFAGSGRGSFGNSAFWRVSAA